MIVKQKGVYDLINWTSANETRAVYFYRAHVQISRLVDRLKTQFRMVRNVIVRTMGAAKLGLQRKLFRNRHIPFRVSATFS